MRKFFHWPGYVIVILMLTIFWSLSVSAATITSNASGSWNSGGTWQGGVVPGSGDAVIIQNGHNIFLSANAACASLTINGGGTSTTFTVDGFSLAVSGTFTIGASSSNNRTRDIHVYSGNLTCGAISMSAPSADSRVTSLSITTGSVTVSGNITMSGTSIRTYIEITGNGVLNLGGTMTGGDFIPSSTASINFNGSAAQTIPINTTYAYSNIRTNNPVGAGISAAITTTNVTGNLSIESGIFLMTTLAIAGNAGKTLSISDGATLNLSSTAVMPTGFTWNISQLGRVLYSRASAQTVAIIPSPGYGILELAGSGAKTAAGALFVQSDLIIGGSSSFAAGANVHNVSGDFVNNSVFTPSTSTIIFSGTAPQHIRGSVATTFANLTMNNSSGIVMDISSTISTNLTLTSGVITTGSNSLTLNSTTTVTGGSSSSWVNGNLKKGIAASTVTKTFEIGDATNYNPVTLTITGTTNGTGSITAKSVSGDHPQILNSDIDVNYSVNQYWSLINTGVTGITSYIAVFTFTGAETDPGTDYTKFIGGLYSASAWIHPAVGTKTSTSIQLTGLTGFGDFQFGQHYIANYRSKTTGNFNDPATWETQKNNGTWIPASSYPNFRDGTIDIISPHVVTVTSALGKDTVDQFTIQTGATLIVNVNPSGYWLSFTRGTGTDLMINGTLEYQDDAFQLLNGAVMAVSSSGKYRVNFAYGGSYQVSIPSAIWDPNSTLEIIACNQLNPAGGFNQNFGHVIWNYPGQTANINLGGGLTTVSGNLTVISTGTGQLQLTNTTALTLTIGGNLVIQGGTVDFANGAAGTKVLNILGNYNQSGGTLTNSNSNVLSVYMKGSGKTFAQSGGTLTNTYTNWIFETGSSVSLLNNLTIPASRTCTLNGTLDCGITTYISGGGTFILNDNAHLLLGSVDGLSNNTTNGNIRTAAKTLGQNASFTYNGNAAQVTGTGMPSAMINLNISNAAGVTLSGNADVKGVLALNNGSLSIGSNSLSLSSTDVPLTKNSGTLATISSSTLQFGSSGLSGGAAFTLPSGLFSAPPSLQNLKIYRTSGITLNDQMISVFGIVFTNGLLNTNNNLTLVSTAAQTALIDGSGTGTISGNVIIQRYLSAAFGYRYISTPITGGTVGNFSSWIDLGAAFPNFYTYDENSTVTGWTTYTTASGAMSPLYGYCGNFGNVLTPVTLSVTGPVNNGSFSRTLYNHNREFTKGFNLTGNPYPSPINWDASSGWTKTNIDNAVYYFNPGNTDQYSGTYSSYINGVSSDGIANGIIPAFQGFLVHVSDGAYPVTGTLAMTNAVRTTSVTPVFHKDRKNIPVIRISGCYSERPSAKDFTVVALTDEASQQFDPQKDALKLMNTDERYPNIYVMKSEQKLSIGSQPVPGDSIIAVPLGINSSRTGTLILKAEDLQGMNDHHVFIYDRKLQVYHDLKATPEVSILVNEGENTGRYQLVFSKTALQNGNPSEDGTFIYSSDGSVFIFISSSEMVTTTQIFDISGRLVWQGKFEGDRAEFRPGLSDGIYVVRCSNSSVTSSQKIFFRR